jgi:hypothetical protein
MPAAAHRVRMQRWRVAARSAGEAFALRTRLKAAVEDELPAVFGRAFDRAAPDGRLLHIARLELRLRVASLEALAGALAEALDEALPSAARRPAVSAPHDAGAAAGAQELPLLLGYLESGTLAWHAAHLEPASLAARLRATLLANLPLPLSSRPAASALPGATRYYFRLLQLLPAQRWLELAASIEEQAGPRRAAASSEPATQDALARLPMLLAHAEAEWPTMLARVIAASGLRAAIARLAAGGSPAIARHDALRLAAALLAAAATQAALSPPEVERSKAAPPLRDGPRDAGHDATPTAPGAQDLLPQPPTQPEPAARPSTRVTPTAAQLRGAGSPPVRDTRAAGQVAGLIAPSVGLVLLHPFLPQLFAACALYRDGELRSPARAAALLHWLATGREEVFEFELAFVKLLLGLRPEAPLEASEGLLGVREREEGQALLQAALGHWKALRNTTPDALRLAFLQRRGALREADDGWRLRPESESYDVLLGHLPWGFATVKLPWMTRPLFTDWPTP